MSNANVPNVSHVPLCQILGIHPQYISRLVADAVIPAPVNSNVGHLGQPWLFTPANAVTILNNGDAVIAQCAAYDNQARSVPQNYGKH